MYNQFAGADSKTLTHLLVRLRPGPFFSSSALTGNPQGTSAALATLAPICVSAGLHQFLRFDDPLLRLKMNCFVELCKTLRVDEDENAAREGRPKGLYWLGIPDYEVSDAALNTHRNSRLSVLKKVFSHLLEAILGALLATPRLADLLFGKAIKPFLIAYVTTGVLVPHPTTTLFQRLRLGGCRNSILIKEALDEGASIKFSGRPPCCLPPAASVSIASTTHL